MSGKEIIYDDEELDARQVQYGGLEAGENDVEPAEDDDDPERYEPQ